MEIVVDLDKMTATWSRYSGGDDIGFLGQCLNSPVATSSRPWECLRPDKGAIFDIGVGDFFRRPQSELSSRKRSRGET